MEYIRWGGREDGPLVSRLGFGTTRFQQSDLSTGEGFEKCVRLVGYAIEKGINYFDVAPTYSNGMSEKILGEAFRRTSSPVYIAAKTGLMIDKTSDDALRRIHSSLMTLGREKIDFYHVWSVMGWEEYRTVSSKDGILDGIMKAKDRGWIDHVCISLHCSPQTALRIMDEGIFEGNTISLNAMNYKKWLEVLDKARQKHIAVVTMNSLAGGLIPQYGNLFACLDESEDTVPQKALRFVLQLPGVHVALSGMPTREILDENCGVLDHIHDTAANRDFALPVHENLCSGCAYCVPCAVGIPIPSCMQAYNHKVLAESAVGNRDGTGERDEQETANGVFGRLRADGVAFPGLNQCIGCHVCEKRCTQKINISERMRWLNAASRKYGYDQETMRLRLKAVEQKCKGCRKIAIWPAADYASRVLDYWDNPAFEERCIFVNASPAMWGKPFRGKLIEDPESIRKEGIDTIVIMHHRLQRTIFRNVSEEYKECRIVCLHEDSDIDWFDRTPRMD